MSIRQNIIDAIAARLGLIASGHVFTLETGGSYTCATSPAVVAVWRKTPFTPAQFPAVGIWDTRSTLDREGIVGAFTHLLEVSIVGFLASSAPIGTARDLQADIVAAIGSDPRWSGLADETIVEELPMDAAQGGDIVAAVEIRVTIRYRAGLWQT